LKEAIAIPINEVSWRRLTIHALVRWGIFTRMDPLANLVKMEIEVIANWKAPIKSFFLKVSEIFFDPACTNTYPLLLKMPTRNRAMKY
jgi:hypothetical protein